MSEARAKLARHARTLNTRHGRGRRLPAIVLMTDDTRDVDWAAAVAALPVGSAVVVRHRDQRARERLARQLMPLCRARRVALLIADDAHVALRVRADGVHVPERRLDRIAGLRSRKRTWLVTGAAHNEAAVRRAHLADAVFVSPVFATASHPERPALGVVRFAQLARAGRAERAVYALGGVETKTIQRLHAHRIVGIALIGGWVRN